MKLVKETNLFAERERALENEFFHRVDQKLLNRLKADINDQRHRLNLAIAGRINSEQLLDELLLLGVKPESLAAVRLIPLVLVCWANGEITPKARQTVLTAAIEEGFEPESPAYELLRRWLSQQPTNALLTAWKHYIWEVCASLSAEQRAQFRDLTLAYARVAARRSHQIFGFEWITRKEQTLLKQLEDTFEEL